MDTLANEVPARLRAAWRAIVDAEQARGAASDPAASVDAQAAYEAALELFRTAQIEAFTIILGHLPLLWERIELLEGRIERLVDRSDIADRVTFADPLNPYH